MAVINKLNEIRHNVFFSRTTSKVGIGLLLGVLVTVVVGLFYPYAPNAISQAKNIPPSAAHIFGTDFLGHDLYSQIAWGAIPSLEIALVGSIGAVLLGLFTGVFAGYFERTGGMFGGVADVIMTFPPLPLLIVLGTLYIPTNSFISMLLLIVLFPIINRAVRNQASSVKRLQYVDSARISGVSDIKIILKVIIPEVTPIAFAYFIIDISISVVLTTALEFLAVGDPAIVSWGSIIYWAEQYAFTFGDWWWILIPGVYIALISTSFALLGYSIEETLNPRLR